MPKNKGTKNSASTLILVSKLNIAIANNNITTSLNLLPQQAQGRCPKLTVWEKFKALPTSTYYIFDGA